MNSSSGLLVEPLTRRERAILLHLVADKSNQEIAVLETLSLNSVKWYVQQIYTKLGVNKRTEVTGRAAELGLLLPEPTPASISSKPKHNLPVQLTSFIGREREINELRLRIKQKNTRLMTLTGSGGAGKTRLALQVAAGLLDAFPDGIWLVELASLADPAFVPQTVINALGLTEQPGKTPNAFLADYLRPKRLLLVLDNCEHLVAACAELAAHLLHNAPQVTILASSREILGVEGEIPFRVPPLEMPDPLRLPPIEDLSRIEAVHLFVERARVVSPAFNLTPDNAFAVVQITQRLDGVPLAIELAAARLRVLSVGQIALRLNDAFRLLTGGARTALPRHQTLQALIDWSYNLLSEEERALLRSLSVFTGSWTLEAAEVVCAAQKDVLDLIRQLADKSLVLAGETPGGEMRYRMLETIRQYAHTRLVEAGEAAAVRTRHLAYYLHRAETLEPEIRSRKQVQILDDWQTELDNLRQALEWALQTDVPTGLRLAASLQWFWGLRFQMKEGKLWFEKLLEAETFSRGDLPLDGSLAVIRANALSVLGGLLIMTDIDPAKSNDYLQEALAIYRANRTEPGRGLAWTLVWLGRCKTFEGDLVHAQVLLDEALVLCRASGDRLGIAECLQNLGSCEIDPAAQLKIYHEMLAIDEAVGDIVGIATAHLQIGVAYYFNGDYEDAGVAFAASQVHYRQGGVLWAVAGCWRVLAITSLLNGDPDLVGPYLDEALTNFRDLADEKEVAWCLIWKSMLAFTQGRYNQVAELNQEIAIVAQNTGSSELTTLVSYHRARLARLRGETAAARQSAEEGLQAQHDLGNEKVQLLLELGHLALQDGDLTRAAELFGESIQIIIQRRDMFAFNWVLDGLAVLAVRKGEMERAARLFGTRLWRGYANLLSPIECDARDADFATLTAALGAERFAQLQAEGFSMPFMQILVLAQAED